MRIRRDFPRTVQGHRDIEIPMPDGVALTARLWLPDDALADPVPVILEHLPYRKNDGTAPRDALTHPWLAGHGYACLRVDMRGNGDSPGLMEDEYTAQELSDACAVIEWARGQPWCSGTAGMMGISWGGFNALQVAALRPEGLKAVITICSAVDRFGGDIHYKGGAMLGENLGWAAQMLAYSSRPPDPQSVGPGWRRMWLDRLEAQPFLLEPWLSHQRRDGYWRHGSVCEDWTAIEAAVLAVGGWHDGYRNAMDALVRNLPGPAKGIAGPWIHKYPHFAPPAPAIGFLQEALRWFDHWLKGRGTGVQDDPAMRLWQMEAVPPATWLEARPGRWIAEPDWPAPGIRAQVWQLSGDGLALEGPPARPRLVESPADCGAAQGEFFPFFPGGAELPGDQRRDDARSACWDSAPLEHPLAIVGAPRVRLRLSCAAPQGQIALRLNGVQPDGASGQITLGVLNLAHRDSHAEPAPVPVDTPFEVEVTLDHCALRLPAGHRLRLAVSTALWPYIWPAPGRAPVTVLGGSLILPLRADAPGAGDEWQFEPPEGAPPLQTEELRAPTYDKRLVTDLASGLSSLEIGIDNGATRALADGLETGSASHERWSIDPADPLSARGEITWQTQTGRGAWQTRTETQSALWCDAGSFHMEAGIRAFDGDELVFETRFERSIPRDNL